MATVVKSTTGKKIVLLNPSEKGTRYARQMRNKCDHNGEVLDKSGMAYRAGYLDAQRDSAKAYCHNNGIKSKAKPRQRKNGGK